MTRRIISLLLALTLMIITSACSSPDSGVASASDSQSNGAASAPESKNITLEFWDMQNGPAETYTPVMEALMKRYPEESGVNVNLSMIPWDNWYQTFLTAVSSNTAPDAATCAFPLPMQFAMMGEALELDSIVEEWKASNDPAITDISDEMLAIHQWDGHQIAFPCNLSPGQIVYRKDYFEAAGITTLPKTWDEFTSVCEKLKAANPDVAPFTVAAGDVMCFHNMVAFLLQNGVGFMTADGKPNMTSPEAIHTMQFFGNLYKEGYIPEGSAAYKDDEAMRMYYSGKTAMVFCYGLPSQVRDDTPELYENTGILDVMHGPDTTQPRVFGWVDPVMGFKQTKYPEETKALLKWYMDNYVAIFEDGVIAAHTPRTSLIRDSFYAGLPLFQEAQKLLPDMVTPNWPVQSLYPAYPQCEGEMYPGLALQEIFTGRSDYETIGAEINEKIQQAIDDNK